MLPVSIASIQDAAMSRTTSAWSAPLPNFAMNAWGPEPVLHMARAMAKKYAQEFGDPDDRLWLTRQDAKIAEAERQAANLTGEAQAQVRRRIAALKRARTLGPAGLRAAAAKAMGTRAGR